MEIKALSVTELNNAVRNVLENHFPLLWVEGELSNLSRPVSGHLYFSLKDAKAQVKCAMFRIKSSQINFDLSNGLQVQVRARVSLYPGRGDYQLIVEQILPQGQGDLRARYEVLLKKLSGLGWFDPAIKKPIPEYARHIGIITSSTGAALRDILSVLNRRFPLLPVTIYPCLVQGTLAAPDIAAAIEKATVDKLCDVLILGRGGGSLEDLWPFNEEQVARAIFECPIPIISAVGHEIDFTISDFVADIRAPTPSAAAEIASPDASRLALILDNLGFRLAHLFNQDLESRAQKLDWLQRALKHPGESIKVQMAAFTSIETQLIKSLKRGLLNANDRFSHAVALLNTISPLSTLERGYAIASHPVNGQIVRSVSELKKNDQLMLRLKDGELNCQIL